MRPNAVVGHTLAIALATAAAGAALCAGPAGADETSKIALAPLPEVLTGASLFGHSADIKGQPKGESKGEEKGDEGGGGQKGCARSDWRTNHVHLRLHPIGYVIDKGVTLTTLTPNNPAGFPAKHYSDYELTYGMGGGTEIGISAARAREFGLKAGAVLNPHPHGSEYFFGGYLQKRIIAEKGILPTVSLGVRGNRGDDELNTFGSYLVATKRVLGRPCRTPGVWITGGMKYERYSTDINLALLTPVGKAIPATSDDGARPFAGMNIALSKNLFASGEWAHRQPWEFHDEWSVKGELLLYQGWGVEGGIENNGYHERTFVDVVLGSFAPLMPHRR